MDTIKDLFLHSCGVIIYAIKPIIFREIHIKNKVACVIINTYIFYKLCKITYDIKNDFYKHVIKSKSINQEINKEINVNEDVDMDTGTTGTYKNVYFNNFNYINEPESYYFHEENPWNNKTDIY
jgi:hypothetical protein